MRLKDSGPLRPYGDPRLHSPSLYGEFIQRLVEAGVAELTLERPTEVVDCFFVKKGGGKQRLVVDCR
eukprot:4147874-Pyramimonas_sp.AAC.1